MPHTRHTWHPRAFAEASINEDVCSQGATSEPPCLEPTPHIGLGGVPVLDQAARACPSSLAVQQSTSGESQAERSVSRSRTRRIGWWNLVVGLGGTVTMDTPCIITTGPVTKSQSQSPFTHTEQWQQVAPCQQPHFLYPHSQDMYKIERALCSWVQVAAYILASDACSRCPTYQ